MKKRIITAGLAAVMLLTGGAVSAFAESDPYPVDEKMTDTIQWAGYQGFYYDHTGEHSCELSFYLKYSVKDNRKSLFHLERKDEKRGWYRDSDDFCLDPLWYKNYPYMKYDDGDLSPYSKVTCRLVCPEYKVKDEQGNIVTKKLVSKSITFRTLPNPTRIVKTSRSKNAVRLYWVKQKWCAGYKIQKYNTKTKKWETAKTIKDLKVTNARVSGLKSGTK